MRDDFAAFILTHGRPDNQITLQSLRRYGYTGRVYLVIDDEDETGPEYHERYGDAVLTFSKDEIGATFDQYDNSPDRRSIVWARNACWQLARDVGARYFIQLDDDYTALLYRRPGKRDGVLGYHGWVIRSLDAVLSAMAEFVEETPAHALCMSQGGDHFGGWAKPFAPRPCLTRKAMNSFVLDAERPFVFSGRINEDVNTYVGLGGLGYLFFTYTRLQLNQVESQSSEGGMTDVYLDSGTYVKSMFTVLVAPSCVRVGMMGRTSRRLHHQVSWRHAVPKILAEPRRRAARATASRARANGRAAPVASLLDRDLLGEFLTDAAAEGVDAEWLRGAIREALPYLQKDSAERAGASRALEDRWYAALAAGAPDYSVYDDPAYLTELWACWVVYSRKYLRAIRSPKAPPEGGIRASLGSVASIADLGCGVGYTSAALRELFPDATVTGTNLDSVQARIARNVGQRYGFRVEAELSAVGHADVVFASEFFEHLAAPVDYLGDVLDALQPRALLVANTFGQRSIGHFDSYFVEGRQLDGAATSRRFGALLRARGYERVETKLWNNRPAYWRGPHSE